MVRPADAPGNDPVGVHGDKHRPWPRRLLPRVAFLAGALPILAVGMALVMNLQSGMAACNVFWEGCLSVSRAVRSGPGLWVFKAAALPAAACMAWTFLAWPRPPATALLARIGAAGALFFLVYAFALGTEGDVYRWMRRFGVVFYFGLVGLAQLLLARGFSLHGSRLWPDRRSLALTVFHVLLVSTWLTGIASAFKRQLVDDPALVDRLQNALEWWFALGLSAVFLPLAFLVPLTKTVQTNRVTVP